MLLNGLQCSGILTPQKQFDIEALGKVNQDGALRKVMVATAVASIANLDALAIEDLQQHFMNIFTDGSSDLSDWQIDLFHAIIAVANDISVKSEAQCPLFMEEDFLGGLKERLDLGRDDQYSMTQKLIERCAQTRTEWLQLEVQGKLTEVEARNKSILLSLLHTLLPAHIIPFARSSTGLESHRQTESNGLSEQSQKPQTQTDPQPNDTDDAFDEFLRRKEAAMKFALQAYENEEQPEERQSDEEPFVSAAGSKEDESSTHRNLVHAFAQSSGLPLHHPAPVAPMTTLPSTNITLRAAYDDARLAAHTRSLERKPPPSSPNATSNRKVWSAEEENTLMEGLEYVRGPHWCAILALYGENGSMSEVLKNRSQVQLKDKARNMKLFFAKHGLEIPEPLKAVTGELKKSKTNEVGSGEDTVIEAENASPRKDGEKDALSSKGSETMATTNGDVDDPDEGLPTNLLENVACAPPAGRAAVIA